MDARDFDFSKAHFERIVQLAALAVAIILVFIGVKSCFYTLDAKLGENAVIQRFGKYVTTVEEPGLHFKLPFGIDTVTIQRVREVRRHEVGFRSTGASTSRVAVRQPTFAREPEHAISITRDHNLVDAEYVIQYRISDLKKYLFASDYPDFTVKQAIKAVVRDVVANRDIDDILTTGREAMQQEGIEEVQKILDAYDIGLRVTAVQFQDVHAPKEVISAFDDVQKAKEERETFINEGKRYRNQVVPQAEGQAKQLITDAEAYKIRRVNEARGDAARFQALYERYKKDPELTRRQLYLQIMGEVLPGMQKTIIEGDPGRFLLPIEHKGGRR